MKHINNIFSMCSKNQKNKRSNIGFLIHRIKGKKIKLITSVIKFIVITMEYITKKKNASAGIKINFTQKRTLTIKNRSIPNILINI